MKKLLYKLQLCGYDNYGFLRIVHKKITGCPQYTARIKRIYFTAVLLCILGVGLPLLFLPRTVVFANIILSPIESAIKNKWLKKAQNKLASPKFKNLIKIGITGSYGKTTCKNILHHILSAQYKVIASRGSWNTPMGFARTVNEDLTEDTEILIMEMGARRPGDIREMCELLKPDHGIITAVGPVHLETFGSIENVKKAKYELFEYVKGIKIEGLGDNVKCCCEMARRLGISEENIAAAVKTLPVIAHRMQIISAPTGVTIIDNSYNSNPITAKAALKKLAEFPGAKTVQTPGFVELGNFAYEYNKEFGSQIAEIADRVIIMSKLNKTALYDGLMLANYSPEKVFFADNLDEAKKIYPQILHAGDILLIENDLPGNY